ncbi:MAG: hypothetical protein COA79_24335 [Planctomycetota bacterium]|nr:MAG: hypothetical protein COA79_24335 [Planctomycetota bacterium]
MKRCTFLTLLFLAFNFAGLFSQDKENPLPIVNPIPKIPVNYVNNKNNLDFKMLQGFTPFIVESINKGKKVLHYFTYTIANNKGLLVHPSNLKEGDVLAADVFTVTGVLKDNEYIEKPNGPVIKEVKDTKKSLRLQIRRAQKKTRPLPLSVAGIRKHVRLFIKGHKLTAYDIRILQRVPYRPLIQGNQRHNVLKIQLNTSLPLDVVDFSGNNILKKGVHLNPRNLAILRQLPIGHIYVQRPVEVNLDIKVFEGYAKTMQCVEGCDEVYSVENSYPGVNFICGDAPDKLAILGIKRITKNSYYSGEDDAVLGCSNPLKVPVAEHIPLQNQNYIDLIWDKAPKVCQFCQTRFQVKDITNFHKAKLKHPTTGKFFEEKIERFNPGAKVALGADTFEVKDIKEYIPEEIECPACGKWLRENMNFLDLNLHPLAKIQKGAENYYSNLQKIPYGHVLRGIAVFSNISRHMDKIQIVLGGLIDEIYVTAPLGGLRPLTSKFAQRTPYKDRKVKKLVIKYERVGDEYESSKDAFVFKSKEWEYISQNLLTNKSKMEFLKAIIKNK